MAIQSTPAPLYEIISLKNRVKRAVEVFILFLLVSLLVYRLVHIKDHGLGWQVALVCESWLTFVWVLVVSTKWSPVSYKTYPQRILQRATDHPPVDVFVTTADPQLEPPIITVNTVLSLMAVDYPAHKLSCYVSDDACSLLTFYSLMDVAKFAKLWVPFWKKYNIQLRAPFRYFASDAMTLSGEDCSLEFQQAWHIIKDENEKLSRKIEDAPQGSVPSDFTGEFAVFSNTERSNHPSIIKIILENKEGHRDELPNLIYISREKWPKHLHHYKAGAMNVLIFYDGIKDDPFGNQMVVLFEYLVRGIVGIQGPFYAGT